ncbi:YopX family protein [Enterococcus casseliflavus]|uniref:YopX family protein n=1 Tax=Enterococcus casseliflavus TaxID=37734 RepID=UPI00115DDCDE|nr:YopX family protein [Enterococcus casseliflavus]
MVPKFRAWDKRENTMRDVAVLHFTKGGKVNSIEYWNTPSELKSYHVRNLVLMQSTGLKDKNGVEIFEGDVVEWLEHRGVVEFVLNNQQTMIIGASGYITDLDYSTDFNTEVIGNIHENPKILGQANEI